MFEVKDYRLTAEEGLAMAEAIDYVGKDNIVAIYGFHKRSKFEHLFLVHVKAEARKNAVGLDEHIEECGYDVTFAVTTEQEEVEKTIIKYNIERVEVL